jgi:pyruvate formate lyase activating enzyme
MDLKEALLWKKEGRNIRCNLCNRQCLIADGKRGNCGVRENQSGKLIALTYGMPCSIAIDPIEKKPFNNFFPGSRALSIATVGCNFHCGFCQNWQISQAKPEAFPTQYVSPELVVEMAVRENCEGIAYTYTEPTIFFEYSNDIAKLAVKEKLYNVFVTNGYMSEEMLKMAKWMDAANVDIKSFSASFYDSICGGIRIDRILDNIKWMNRHKIHVEITTLLIPGVNDSEGELRGLAQFLASVDKKIPLHFSRFHPDYKMMNYNVTPKETLLLAYKIAKEAGLRYVYVGNIPGEKLESTFCPKCNYKLINRVGFSVTRIDLDKTGKNFVCPNCGERQDIVG